MIPEFPEFKNLELGDKAEIEALTSKYPPYSDFNFTSMWAWNIKGEMKLSKLNGNLVVMFNDYITGTPFYSFLGVNEVADTTKRLLDLSIKENIKPELKLLTEEAINQINVGEFLISEDPDNADYILSVDSLKNFSGGKFMAKRNYLKRFKNSYKTSTKLLDLNDQEMKEKVIDLFNSWYVQKGIEKIHVEHELNSLVRLLDIPDKSNFISIGIFSEEKLIAFWILEKIDADHCISHYEKANIGEYIGIYPYLVNESAKILDGYNIKYINFEQDLGIPGLRESKRSYAPCGYLKQYTLTHRNA